MIARHGALMTDAIEQDGRPDDEARQWAMFCHLSALLGSLVLAPGFGSVIGPLVVWLVKKSTPFVDDQGCEALNFNISMLIWGLIAGLLCFVLIGFVLLPVLGLVWLICTIIAAVRARDGIAYRYPLTIRFVRPAAGV